MDAAGKRRAADFASERAARKGVSTADLAERSSLDVATVRDFLEGRRWPRSGTRHAIEDVLGLPTGSFELVARGFNQDDDADIDEVERAIKGSPLTRANQHRLIGLYFEMLEGQQGVRGA